MPIPPQTAAAPVVDRNPRRRGAGDGSSETSVLREDYNALEKDKAAALAEVAALDAADDAQPGRQHPDDVALLDALPYLQLNLAGAQQPLLRACSRPPG